MKHQTIRSLAVVALLTGCDANAVTAAGTTAEHFIRRYRNRPKAD